MGKGRCGNLACFFAEGRFQRGETALLGSVEFQLHLLDIQLLLFELLAAFGNHPKHDVELLLVAGLGVVQLDQRLVLIKTNSLNNNFILACL